MNYGITKSRLKSTTVDSSPHEKTIVVSTIYFTTTDGPDATQFDTQDIGELLELFHEFLIENGLTLISVDEVDQYVI